MLKEVDQVKYLGSTQTNDGQLSKRSKDQTGTSALGHEKAGNTVEKQSHQFLHKDYTL